MTHGRSCSVLCAALLLAGACAGTQSSRGAPVVQRFVAEGAGASHYASAPPEGAALLGPHAVRAGRGVALASQSTGRPLIGDARLAQLAEQSLRALAQGTSPPYAALELWARHLGLVEPTPHMLALRHADPATLDARTHEELSRMLPRQRYTHYGLATLDEPSGASVVIVLSWRLSTLEPLPRAVAPGTTLAVRGSLIEGVRDGQLVVTEPSGVSRRLPRQTGAAFAAQIVAAERGPLRVEVLATTAQGPAPVVNVPIYVGVAPPTEVSVTTAGGEGVTLDVGAFAARMLELVNAERARAGVRPVALEPTLTEVAERHGQDMRAHGFVGHTSARTGTAADRVARAGVRTKLVLENIGRGYAPEEVHQGLLDSPGHRDNVVSADATHVGIGVVIEPEDDRAAYLVTEVFVRLASKIDLDDAPEELLEALNRAREQQGARELRADAALAALASSAARRFFEQRGASQKVIVESLNREAAKRARGYSRIASVMTTVSTLDEAAALAALLDPAAKAIGLGLAQGTRDDTIADAIAVVAVLAY